MGNAGHIKILKKGLVAWNEWRLKNPEIEPDLNGEELGGKVLYTPDLIRIPKSMTDTDVEGWNFSDTDLSGAKLKGADLFGANLSNANLSFVNASEANMMEANLQNANLSSAILSGANMKGACLTNTVFVSSNLEKADLRNTIIKNTNFTFSYLGEANLSSAKIDGADISHTALSGATVDERTLKNTKHIKGGIVGINGLWSKGTDSAALMIINPPGNSMEGPNPNAVLESLIRARKINGYSLSLVGIVLLIQTLSLSEIPFPYAKDVKISPAQFVKLAMPMSIALLYMVNTFLTDALRGVRYISDRSSAMLVGNFPWIISKFHSTKYTKNFELLTNMFTPMETKISLIDRIYALSLYLQSFLSRFILSFHGVLFIYFSLHWTIFPPSVFYPLSFLVILFSSWTFWLSQKFQKPILFDNEIENKRQSDSEKIIEAIKLQTKAIRYLKDGADLNKQKIAKDSDMV